MENLNRIKRIKNKHVVISDTNYYKLKSMGRMGDTFDKVLGNLLSKENYYADCNLGEVSSLARLQSAD